MVSDIQFQLFTKITNWVLILVLMEYGLGQAKKGNVYTFAIVS